MYAGPAREHPGSQPKSRFDFGGVDAMGTAYLMGRLSAVSARSALPGPAGRKIV